MKLNANNIVLRLLGVLLLVAAILKGWQLVTEPVANNSIWNSRWFLIVIVEFELAMGIWLLSGLFKRMAWLVSLMCFSLFTVITLYKGISGAASCGCFGNVEVNPWVTFSLVDLPAVVLLLVFRPCGFVGELVAFVKRRRSIVAITREVVAPLPNMGRVLVTGCLCLVVVAVSGYALSVNEPAVVTASYEVLEPTEWIGEELPILESIEIDADLTEGNWVVLLYHYDCPDCREAIVELERMGRDLEGNEDFLQIALVAMPPYGEAPISENTPCKLGRLPETKEWFGTTPIVVLLQKNRVKKAWEGESPGIDTLINSFLD